MRFTDLGVTTLDREELIEEDALDLDEIRRLIDMDPEIEDVDEEPKHPTETDVLAASEDCGKDSAEKKTAPQKSIVLYLHDLAYLIAGIVLVFLLCFRIVIVSGDSMYDTLVDGDYLLLLSNVFYQEPRQGDIIVASKEDYENGTPIIKRVIATEGQEVDIDFVTGTVYVDGVALEEEYIYSSTTMDEGVTFPLIVEEGCVFVLGDNRGRSKDSRSPEIGQIDSRQIVGKAIMLIYPGSNHGFTQPLFDRIGGIG